MYRLFSVAHEHHMQLLKMPRDSNTFKDNKTIIRNKYNKLFIMLKRYQSSFTHLTARISNLALVKSENRLALKVILQVFLTFSLRAYITLQTTQEQTVLAEQSRNYGILFMKKFYNVVNFIICCAKEARASIVLNVLDIE